MVVMQQLNSQLGGFILKCVCLPVRAACLPGCNALKRHAVWSCPDRSFPFRCMQNFGRRTASQSREATGC